MGLRTTLALGLGAALGAAVVFIACGIDEGGVVGPPASSEGGPDVQIDTNLPPACGDAAACLTNVPAGWQITGLLPDPKSFCPTNFNTADQIKDLSASGCACTCTAAGTPSCGGSIVTYKDNGGASDCTGRDAGMIVGDGGCIPISSGGQSNVWVGATAPPLQGITCTPTRTGTATVDSVPVRLCEPTCQADFCGQLTAAGATACIINSTGDVPCPAGYKQRTVVATSGNVACAPCNGCSPPAASCTGTVSLWGSATCSGAHYTAVADGTCKAGPSGPGDFGSLSEQTTAPGSPCNVQANDPGGDAGPVGAKTLCCP